MKTVRMIMAALTTNIRGEACEELAMANPLRASGNGANPQKSFAKNIAVQNAKVALGRALSEQVNGMIRIFNADRDSEIAEGYFEQFLTNARTIRTNTYVKPDGTYHVHVCVEMGVKSLSVMHKKLSEDKKIPIDFSEQRFKQAMEKAREDYLKRLNGNYVLKT